MTPDRSHARESGEIIPEDYERPTRLSDVRSCRDPRSRADERMDTCSMNSQRPLSPAEKRVARAAAREGDKIRRRAIEQAMLAGWADEDSDESNWIDAAAQAHPGPSFAAHYPYGLSKTVVERLADPTGEDRERLIKEILR